jgi:2-succinyl-5-enolpyruvyl-6-hydroxy-3-cyclohexene-1-carboxylate synthase
VNPSTAFATVLADELVRCGLTEAVLAPGSRSAPLAMALWQLGEAGRLRLHVRIDERSAAFLALGLAKAGGRPVAVLCTSGTAAANFHPAVIEADESGVPLLVLTADRPPELRGTGANQTIDQVKLYGSAVRWFSEAGVPEARHGMNAYWRSLACRAWAHARGAAGGFAGPVHLNLPLRDPLVPDPPGTGTPWPESLDGRPDGAPWTAFTPTQPTPATLYGTLDLPWVERGVIVCGDGWACECEHGGAGGDDGDSGVGGAAGYGGVEGYGGGVGCGCGVGGLLRVAEAAGWPVLAEPSSGGRRGPNALRAYSYLLASPEFVAGYRPELIVSVGRPGLHRGQLAFLRGAARRHVVIAQGPGRWADPARSATDVASGVRLSGRVRYEGKWLEAWKRADTVASAAADEILDGLGEPSEPRLARDLAAALPDGALLWVASSQPARDLDQQMAPRDGLRVLASRGASGIDGLASTAIGAALAHAAAGGGPAYALLGDLAFLHDLPGLVLGPREPRPDLCLVVVNNDGGGIFSGLEQAAFAGPFERVFGTPHGWAIEDCARAAGLPYRRLGWPAGPWPDGPWLDGAPGGGLRVIELTTNRTAQAELRVSLQAAALHALARLVAAG